MPGRDFNGDASPSSAKKKSPRSRTPKDSPYARRQAVPTEKKKTGRRIWNHALEKFLFTPHEIATLGAPNRRTIYLASLEAHIDRLHHQLLGMGLYPIPFEALTPYKGLNCKTAKSMVAALQFDIAAVRLNLFELERAVCICYCWNCFALLINTQKSSLQDAIAMRQSQQQIYPLPYPFSS
ncbi:hypothetical protein BD410DRAFT_711189 [Rickenella mellea]|uniref:Uncharacterized protein n=1 Tax=Rickenella mellea TaxID=50990 RepID=A0A4Y7QN99_9AGAM|nr:hypothetical protein BD410DRAFT_711189 [Rickenella mellea]